MLAPQVIAPWFVNSHVVSYLDNDDIERGTVPVDIDSLMQIHGHLRMEYRRAGASPLSSSVASVASSDVEIRLECQEGRPLQEYPFTVFGLIEPDMSLLFKRRAPSILSGVSRGPPTTICFEVKVKCGLKSTSPFVHPGPNEIKWNISRYRLMQTWKAHAKASERPWATVGTEYDPTDICSGQEARVYHALTCLFDAPRNNLRVSMDHRNLYGWERTSSVDEMVQMLSSALGLPVGSSVCPCPQEVVKRILSAIMSDESALCDLEAMQALDLLDVEGVKEVYDRLVSLMGGNEPAVTAAIVSSMDTPFDQGIWSLAQLQRDRANGKHHGTCSFAGASRAVDELFALQVSKGMDDAEIWRLRSGATAWLETLDEHDCLLLIRMSLAALAASDASVMVALEIQSSNHQDQGSNEAEAVAEVPHLTATVVRRQTAEYAGVVSVRLPIGATTSTGATGYTVSYSIGLIDIGPKDVGKISSKAASESAICAAVQGLVTE
jgi:Inositol-pentakisphosphate 2-kinase